MRLTNGQALICQAHQSLITKHFSIFICAILSQIYWRLPEGEGELSPLEKILKRELHDPGVERALKPPELAVVQVAARIVKVRMVQHIGRFGSEFQMLLFADIK